MYEKDKLRNILPNALSKLFFFLYTCTILYSQYSELTFSAKRVHFATERDDSLPGWLVKSITWKTYGHVRLL